jgi:hypothetical protein
MPSPGASFLNAFIKDKQKEAGNEPEQLPSIQSAQSDADQFNLYSPTPQAASDRSPVILHPRDVEIMSAQHANAAAEADKATKDAMMRDSLRERMMGRPSRSLTPGHPRNYGSVTTPEGWGAADRFINQYK